MAEDRRELEEVGPGFSQTEDDLMPVPKLRRASVFTNPVFLLVLLVVAAVVGLAFLLGSKPTPDELVAEGNVLVMQDRPSEALERFQGSLALDPQNVDAHRGMANAYQAIGDNVRQVEWLDRGLGLEGLKPAQEAVLRSLVCRHYLAEAVKVADVDPEGYEAALTKAVQYNPRCTMSGKQADDMLEKAWATTASGLLARHLMERAGEAEKMGKTAQAAGFLNRIGKLRLAERIKEKALLAEVPLRFKLFKPKFDEEFEAKHKDGLVEAGEFDPVKRRFLGTAKVTSRRPDGMRQKEHTWNTHVQAEAQAKEAILDLMAKVAGEPRDNLDTYPDKLLVWSLKADKNEWLTFVEYEMVISMPYDEGAYLIFLIGQRKELGDGGME